MASIYKVLGQLNPAATTLDILYQVPTSTSTVASTLSVCNQGVSTTIRVAVIPVGTGPINAKHYVVYDATVNQYDSLFLTLGLTLADGDLVFVYAGTANVSFNLYGSEIA